MSQELAVAATEPGRASVRHIMDLILIMTGSVFTGLLTIVMAPIMPQVTEYFGDHHNSRIIAQMIMVLPCVGVILAGPVMGSLIDRRGVREVLLCSAFLYTLCGLVGLFTESIAVLVGSRVLLGVAGSGIYASSFALVGERYDGARRRSILGYKGAVGAGSATAVVLFAGLIGQAWGWRSVFVLYLLAVPVFLLALGLKTGRGAPRQPGSGPTARALLPLWPIIVLMVLVFALTYSPMAQGGHLLAGKGIATAGVVAVLLACSTFAYMMASGFYGLICRRFQPQTTFRVGLALFGAGLCGTALGQEPAFIGACMFAMGFGNGMTAPYLHNLVLEKAAPEVRGRASGFVSPAHYSGEFINPPIFQLLSGFGDLARSFLILGAGAVAGALMLRPDRWGGRAAPRAES